MADQPATEDKAVDNSAPVTPEPNLLETTTVKDGHLPINVSVPTAPASAAGVVTPVATVPETPILVTEAEVAPTESNGAGLADEVESLSGEIQALEAKIDRLTGSVKPVVDSSTDTASSTGVTTKTESTTTETATTVEAPAKVDVLVPADGPKPTEPIETASSPIPSVAPSPAPPPTKSESKTVGINDIYSKIAQSQKEADAPAKPNPDDAEDVTSGSSVGTIGEVLAVFGVIIFMIMGAFPFYKTLMPENIIEAIRSIGWPTTVVSLALGFLMSLFSHGKITTKIFTVIILIFAVVLYLGVAGFQKYLGPLGPMLDSVFIFYR